MQITATDDTQREDHSKPHLTLDNMAQEDMLLLIAMYLTLLLCKNSCFKKS
jgi:hypothetical protein